MTEHERRSLCGRPGDGGLVEHAAEGVRLGSPEAAQAFGEDRVFVGSDGERNWYAARARVGVELPPGLSFVPARRLFADLPEATLHLVGRAIACVEFEETHRFCGRCATPTQPGPLPMPSKPGIAIERVRVCPGCGLTFHPRIPPAVIVLVQRGTQLLLARGPNFPPGRFSAVAGFVEIGESLEQAARREVREEVGVTIAELRYFASQPWPFGHSLMVAFHAEHAGGELRADGVEIVEARWFERDALPLLPPPISIARKLIDNF